MQTLIASIIIFGLLIFFHEFGHFIVAKLVGIRVEEFSIGMGPRLIGSKKGETDYSIRVFPIGGYVKMSGEDAIAGPKDETGNEGRRFNDKSVLQRMAVIVAGPLMNFVLAVVLFAVIYFAIGIPVVSNVIGEVIADRPAALAGMKAGDKIVEIDGQPVTKWDEIVGIIHQNPNQKLTFVIERQGERKTFLVTPEYDEKNKAGMIGIAPSEPFWQKSGLFESLSLGVHKTLQLTYLIIDGLVKLIIGQVSTAELTGPVGIVKLISESAKVGIVYLFNFAAFLSINLGLLNLLPIPALDGSRLIFLSIEGVRGRPVDPEKENFIHLIGFAFLILLMLVITYQDIIRYFG